MALPANGPNTAETSSASEKPANTSGVLMPKSRAIEVASMAGK